MQNHFLLRSSSGDTDLHIALNGVEIFSRFVAPFTNGTNRVSYSQPLTLQGGDVLEFLVGRGADNMVAGSGLKLAIQIGKSPVSQVYNLSRDYSLASNPNGAWSYGWKTNVGGVFRNFGFSNHLDYANGIIYDQWARYQNNQSAITRNSGTNTASSDFGQFEAPPGTVWVNPGLNGADDNFAGARFTVPAGQGGNYQIGALVESLLVGTCPETPTSTLSETAPRFLSSSSLHRPIRLTGWPTPMHSRSPPEIRWISW